MEKTKENKAKYLCPVCGCRGMEEPAYTYDKSYKYKLNPSHEICPCCGFQFGLDDYDFDKGNWYEPRAKAYEIWRKNHFKDGVWDK